MGFWRARGYGRLFRLGVGRVDSPEAEMDEEIEAHLEMRTADLVRGGLAPDQARREAVRLFHEEGLDLARDHLRRGARRRARASGVRLWFESVGADIRLALRQGRRHPGSATVSVAVLALGIGLTTATFTLVRSVLLRPLPLARPDELVTLAGMDSVNNKVVVVSAGNWLDWQRESRTIAATALHLSKRYAVSGDGPPRRVATELVSADYFRMLGTRFVAGRSFTAAEVAAGDRVAIVSERFWRQRLGSDPALRQEVEIESRRYRIVGVVIAGQEFPAGTEVWIPLHFEPEHGAMRNNINWLALARLNPGVTGAQAAAELSTIARRIRAAEPEALYSYGVIVAPLMESVLGEAPKYLSLLMVAVLLVLLVACTNLAAVSLARGLARSRETAVRAALGAGQPRLTRQILVEHGLTAIVGGALGLTFAHVAVGLVVQRWGTEVPRAGEIHLDWSVILFGIGCSLGAGVLTGLAPVRQAGRPALSGLMAAGGRGQMRGGRGLPGAPFLVAQVALSMVLLTGAGLLIRSLRVLLDRDLGYTTEVVTAGVTLSADGYGSDPKKMVAYWDAVIESLHRVAGVTAVGVANWVPLESMAGTGLVETEGRGSCTDVGYRAVSEEYHRALGVPLLAGRWLGQEDAANGERVVLVNRRTADACWPGENALGKRIRAKSFEEYYTRGNPPWLTVVGIVGDIRQWGPDFDTRPEMYVLVRQIPQWAFGMTAVVRGGPIDRLQAVVRDRVQEVDPRVAVEVGTLATDLAGRLSTRRLVISLLGGFGGFALLLTAIGLYGLLAYAVSQRIRELALRAALGATRPRLVRTVALNGLGVVLAGAVLGTAAAAGLTRFMQSLLVEVSPLDPVTLAAAAGLLATVSLLAILLPAVRATRLDPAAALQTE